MVKMTFVEWLNYFASAPKVINFEIKYTESDEEELIAATCCIFPIM